MEWRKSKQKFKYLIYFLELTSVVLVLYLVVLPFYPELKYNFVVEKKVIAQEVKTIEEFKEAAKEQINFLPQAEFDISPHRLIINKIGVNIPIVVSKSSEYGLSQGAWLDPESSRPDVGGNTVITGHRFKYLPPSNLTFYLLHKLEPDDFISVLWEGEYYFYQVKEKKIVEPENLGILKQTDKSIITLYTCDPIYSQKNRLVVIAELLDDEENESGDF